MADRKNGLAPLPSGLFRPTAAGDQSGEPVDDQVDGEQGRGDAAEPTEARAPRSKRKRVVKDKTKGRKLSLSDGVNDRLQLLAIRRRTTASAIAEEYLNRHLPRLKIDEE